MIERSASSPLREGLDWSERWKGPDRGLIQCWEQGRRLRETDQALAAKVEAGELPVLAWTGGCERSLKNPNKFGSLNYLAFWQGLAGQDLRIDPDGEVTLVCTRTGVSVTYTPDSSKYVAA